MSKPYTRGNFRAITTKYPSGRNAYQLQVFIEQGNTWLNFGTRFDYLGNARQRVRNLHAACCTHLEICECQELNFPGRSYIRTGKLRKAMKLKTS